ncbi:hypothetical protein Tsubulata_043975 [Turnera subulata]|uniref:Potassium transporter n=1 Tax=Turnera subulata TaxID=218843 RepID=A0A9Q0JNZ7_9ROSI|nr:hypothetical protein Tsubulata_043975 [Turnera subulata]
MDPESGSPTRDSRLMFCRSSLILAYQSFGVVYGDLSTSPIYVFHNTFSGRLRLHEEDDEIFGVFSLVFWTLTLIPLCKYIVFVLGADDNGEGGTFALYSLLCRRARVGLLSSSCCGPEDHRSARDAGVLGRDTTSSSVMREFFDKHLSSRIALLLVVLLGTSMVVGDGVLTPSMSVLSAVYGIKIKATGLHENYAVFITCLILVGLFALQHFGTHRVGFLFAPILLAWLLCISAVGMYNVIRWNPRILRALSPYYVYNLFKKTRRDGWVSLGGIVLCITGAEAMFADLGHFSQLSIRLAFTGIVYPCLIVAYMGEAAYLSKHKEDLQRSFYQAIPGLAVITVMFITTCLMFLVIVMVWKQHVLAALAFLIVFGSFELLYLSACVTKVHKGGWLPLLISALVLAVMCIWHYGTFKKQSYESQNKISLDTILSLGPNLGINRVPGVGLIYTNVLSGIPPMFSHFVTNFPAFHQVLIFVTFQNLTVPRVSAKQRFSVSRIGPPEFRLYRCVVKFGYKDARMDAHSFESNLIETVAEFLLRHSDNCDSRNSGVEHNLRVEEATRLQNGVEAKPSKKTVRFRVGRYSKEMEELEEAREAGLAYMMGNTCVLARETSSFVKKFVLNVAYGFLKRNCRSQSSDLGVPHTSLIEVGMVYRV